MLKERTELQSNRPIDGTDKVIMAAFKQAIEAEQIPDNFLTSYRTSTQNEKSVFFIWEEWDGEQNVLRGIEVEIFERHLQVDAYIAGAINLDDLRLGVRYQEVGTVKLPIFTDDLKRKIAEAIELSKMGRKSDLFDPIKYVDTRAGRLAESRNLSYVGLKKFVDGI